MRALLLSIGVGLLVSASSTVAAEEITFTFSRIITIVEEGVAAGGFVVGQGVEGSYTFDPTAVDQNPSSTEGR